MAQRYLGELGDPKEEQYYAIQCETRIEGNTSTREPYRQKTEKVSSNFAGK